MWLFKECDLVGLISTWIPCLKYYLKYLFHVLSWFQTFVWKGYLESQIHLSKTCFVWDSVQIARSLVDYHYLASPTPQSSISFQVDRLQSDLSNQYLQYRDERDARKLLIWQLNNLNRSSVKEVNPADENTGRAATIHWLFK